jgi:hypothetical protein
VIIVNLTSDAANAYRLEERTVREQKVSGLKVNLIAHKRRYKRTDQLKLDVVLTNTGKEPFYIFGTLDWGYSASLVFHIRDASGKLVEPRGFLDELTSSSPEDKSAFVKLLPHHFLGTNFFSPLDVLNLHKPGKYAIVAEYSSPFLATEVPLDPFWGKESGPVKSNVVWIEVLR